MMQAHFNSKLEKSETGENRIVPLDNVKREEHHLDGIRAAWNLSGNDHGSIPDSEARGDADKISHSLFAQTTDGLKQKNAYTCTTLARDDEEINIAFSEIGTNLGEAGYIRNACHA